MLADFVGTNVPSVLILNMMDVAKGQGISINTEKLSSKLGIPVVPMSAIHKKDYSILYDVIEKSLMKKPVIKNNELHTVKGKFMAFGIIIGIFLLSMIFAGIISGLGSAILTPIAALLKSVMEHFSVHPLLISLICDVLVNVLYFALMMASFVLGITFGFNLMEETGYLARISFLFDHTMSKIGLQGKTIMPFFMGLGCTIAGTTDTRVVDNWGQRVLAIAMSWAVPCTATLSVVPSIAIALFGSNGGFWLSCQSFYLCF